MAVRRDRIFTAGAQGPSARSAARRLALGYAVVALAWVVGSDYVVAHLGLPGPAVEFLSSAKGTLFVVVTGGFLYVLALRALGGIYRFEERYRRLFANAADGIVLYRVVRGDGGRLVDLVIEDVNQAQLEALGLSAEQVLGRRANALDEAPERLRRYLDLARGAVVSGARGPFVLHFEDTDQYFLASIYEADDDLWASESVDITDRRRAQEAQRREEEGIRQAYVDVLDAVTGGKLVLLTEEEIAAELGMPLTDRIPLTSASQLTRVRKDLMEAARTRIVDEETAAALQNAAGEALNNALKHARDAWVQAFAKNHIVQIAVWDAGPGIDFRTLPKAALVPGYSTVATLGMGFTIMLQLADRVLLSTRPGRTTIIVEVGAKPAEKKADPSRATVSATGAPAAARGRRG